MEVVVTGMSLLSSLGSLSTSWQNLLAGRSGIKRYQPFRELPPLPLGLMASTPAPLNRLTPVVVAAALQDANLVTPLPECGVVIGSSRGCQGVWEQLARQRIKEKFPQDSLSQEGQESLDNWLETLPHQGAIAAAQQICSTAPVLAPMAACATGIWAIARGFELIKTGHCQQVIAGAVEAPVTPLTLAGFAKMGALAKTGAYPFDKQREGLVLGEGAAVLVLESAESASSRGVPVYGKILGFGLTADAYHVSAPNPNSWSAVGAVQQCLERSQLSASDIHYIHAHGTSTKLNDYNEANLIQHLFSQGIPVSSTKGATGHTLGASGAIGAAFCLMALKHQILPPCVGLREAEFCLNFVTKPHRSEIQNVLCFSFGFGGQNAVMALGKSE